VLDDPAVGLAVKAGTVLKHTFRVQVLAKGPRQGVAKVSFDSQGMGDRFEQPLEVMPKGFPANASLSGKAISQTLEVDVKDLVPGSFQAGFMAYPDVVSDLMGGVESILREPYGCFEQTSSSTYPNIMALQFLENTGQDNPTIRAKAMEMIKKGYKKLVAYETQDKGYEWFGSTPPHEGLTAYGLMEFEDMKDVYASVDPKIMDRTTNWLLSRRDGKGGFKRSDQALDEFGRASEAVNNAYITYALSEAGHKDIDAELDAADKKAIASKDAYQLALIANAYYNIGDNRRGDKVLAVLEAIIDKGGAEALQADHSITMSGGQSLQVETASLVCLALLKAPNKNMAAINAVVGYIVGNRSGYGGFGSTQATILALKALTQYAVYSKQTATSGGIEILLDNKVVATHPQ